MMESGGSAGVKPKRLRVVPEAELACGDGNGGVVILKERLAGPRKQRRNHLLVRNFICSYCVWYGMALATF